MPNELQAGAYSVQESAVILQDTDHGGSAGVQHVTYVKGSIPVERNLGRAQTVHVQPSDGVP